MSDEEQIILVDKHDKVIGFKSRSQRVDSDCSRSVSVWVENDNGQVLLQQRSFDKQIDPGKWTPAAEGTVSKGTSYDESAKRELEEEIGLSEVKLDKRNKVYCKFSLGWRQMQGYYVLCNWPIEKFKPQVEEVEKIEWVDKRQVIDEISGKLPHTRAWPGTCVLWTEWFNLA